MRRIALIVTAVGLLVAAAAAYAAGTDSYKGSGLKFSSKAAGTAKRPAPVSFTQDIKVTPGTPGNRTEVLSLITTKVYGLKVDGKDFPTCSPAKISSAQTDTVCPKGAAVATGYITAQLGDSSNFSSAGQACNPLLDVWNNGQGKLSFFFVDAGAHQCLGGALHTGQVGAWAATYKTAGKYLVVSVPIPKTVTYPVGGLAGSLESEHLVWKSATAKVKGKKVTSIASVACQGKKRPFSMTFTAGYPNQPTKATTVSGTAACK